jgi:hypothetical protein
VPLYNPLDSTAVVDGALTPADLAGGFGWGTLASGSYYFTSSATAVNTSSTLANGTFRVAPWYVPNACTISRIGAEITSAGDAGSKLRIGIYSDTGSCAPGSLLLDAGTIAGDSATVQEITVSQALTPGIYWVGAAVQLVTVTQPTARVLSAAQGYLNLPLGTSAPSANQTMLGFSATGATAALPGSFNATVTTSSLTPRVFVKVA